VSSMFDVGIRVYFYFEQYGHVRTFNLMLQIHNKLVGTIHLSQKAVNASDQAVITSFSLLNTCADRISNPYHESIKSKRSRNFGGVALSS
jgi:hypothetical protein